MNRRFIFNVAWKALLLFIVLNLILVLVPMDGVGRITLYNHLFPGRQRFTFGENSAQSYSLTTSNLDLLFGSHVITNGKAADEFRVVVIGDSSVWGTLLKPEETLTGQLNALGLQSRDGRRMAFYNLAYPTISLWKDAVILDRAIQYQPDMVIWMVTLEAFPSMNPVTSPFLAENTAGLNKIRLQNKLPEVAADPQTIWQRTLIGQRRNIADWYRLQLYGVMWAATGIDQVYPADYTPAKRDFNADSKFNTLDPQDLAPLLDFSPLEAGLKLVGDVPVWIVNEPMLISQGQNSSIRYNAYYPRWAYDQYRSVMTEKADQKGWKYIDLWDIVPQDQFTNSAIHMTPAGEKLLAGRIAAELER